MQAGLLGQWTGGVISRGEETGSIVTHAHNDSLSLTLTHTFGGKKPNPHTHHLRACMSAPRVEPVGRLSLSRRPRTESGGEAARKKREQEKRKPLGV